MVISPNFAFCKMYHFLFSTGYLLLLEFCKLKKIKCEHVVKENLYIFSSGIM